MSYSGFAIHLTPKSRGKAKGLKIALELLGVSPKNVVCIGYGLNDLELLTSCTNPATVSNTNEELKKIAKYVSHEPSSKGFAEIARKIIAGYFS